MSESLSMLERRRRLLRWRCRRGTLELDEILHGYIDRHLETMTEAALSEFEALLALPDDVLIRWLVVREVVDQSDFSQLVAAILTVPARL